MSLKVLAFGPVRGMITGQQLAFLSYVQHSSHKVKIVDIGSVGYGNITKALLTVQAVAKGIALMAIDRPDRIYLTSSRSPLGCLKDICILLAARCFRLPVVNHLHGNGFKGFRDDLPRWGRWILDTAYRAIPVSIVLAEGMEYHYAPFRSWMSVRVVHNCSEKLLDEYPGLKSQTDSPLRVLFLSNFLRLKGVMEFARGMALFAAAHPQVRVEVRLVGSYSGSSADVTSEELEGALANVPNVQNLGVVDSETKWQCLAWADVLVFPSYHPGEAAPLCLIESLAMGCLPVSTSVGYTRNLLKGSVHLEILSKDAKSIADALMILIGDRHLLDKARVHNLRIARERFSIASYVAKIDAIIRQLS